MNLTTLMQSAEAHKRRKRKARGPGSGNGKWAGRGQGGDNHNSGRTMLSGFEGGQTPLYRRIPRKGFTNANFQVKYVPINLKSLNQFDDGAVVDLEALKSAKLVRQLEKGGVKILAKGTLEKKLTVKVNKISKTAQEQIEKLGGTVELI